MSSLSIAAYFPFERVKVVRQDVHLNLQLPGAQIRLEPDRRCRPLCHVCGQPATVHSGPMHRMVRDLNMAQAEVLLLVQYRRVWCHHCGKAKVEQLSFCDRWKRITHRLACYIYHLCKLMTVQDVAQHLNLDPKTVKAVEKAFLERDWGRTDYEGLSILAIDEIALGKGQQGYMTVVLDHQTGRVVWMGEGRSMETLDAFFGGMTSDQRKAIQAVALDMWEPYINRVQYYCPQAKIVFDFFHVVKAYGEVIDQVRRDEQNKADRSRGKVLKGSRYLLLSNRRNLRPDQRVRLRELLELNERLNSVYVLKDQLKCLYRYRYRACAKKALDLWCELASEVDHPKMRRFIERLRFFEYGILNHCQYAISTGKLEGVNNKIKVIKRKAYGFHDPRYFALKVKQALPGQKPTTETG
jgi:transposase